MIDNKKKFYLTLASILLVSALLAALVAIVEPQLLLGQNILYSILVFTFLILIFSLLIPPVNKYVIDFLKQKRIFYILSSSIILFLPLLNWIYAVEFKQASSSFLIWYFLPTILFIIPAFFENFRFDFLFHIAAVVLFAIGFDGRFTSDTLSGFSSSEYNFNALWVSSLILLLYSIQLNEFEEKTNWKPSKKGVLYALNLSAILAIISIPIGLLTNFLEWSPNFSDVPMIFISFIGIWMTIALPEELIARGVIQHQLTNKVVKKDGKYFKYWKWGILIVASVIFGISHWNNTSPEFIWVYILLASIAGVAYGICWWKGGLFSAILIHTLVDWVWQLFFKTT
jgi:membrane protease YdiL (CAAX protease family)